MKHAKGSSRKPSAEKAEPAVSRVISDNRADKSPYRHHPLNSDVYHTAPF